MGRLVTASIEIFHDAEGGRLDTGPALQGIEIVTAIAGQLEIVRQDRLLKISKPGAAQVRPQDIRWPDLQTDLALVLTERPLNVGGDGGGTHSAGASNSIVGVALGYRRLAVINVVPTALSLPKYTVAHELGHLFGLKREGTWILPDSSGHCRREDCLMYPRPEAEASVERNRPAGIRRVLEGVRLISPSYRVVQRLKDTMFCQECSNQLEQEGQRRALGKIGINLPRFNRFQH